MQIAAEDRPTDFPRPDYPVDPVDPPDPIDPNDPNKPSWPRPPVVDPPEPDPQ